MKLDYLFEMTNLRKNNTGLPVNISVSSGGSSNNLYGPRLSVMTSDSDKFDHENTISVILKKDITANDIVGYDTLPSTVLTKIREYINLNYDVLIQYWNDEIDTLELVKLLKPIT